MATRTSELVVWVDPAHRFDYDSLLRFAISILDGFPQSPSQFIFSQVERWAKQYIFSTDKGKSNRNPRMLELSDWLCQNIPQEDYSEATTGLVHGDFRIDNLVFHPTEAPALHCGYFFGQSGK